MERVAGVVCLDDLRRSRRSAWSDDRVGQVMTPWKDVVSVSPKTPVTEAMRLMAEHDVERVAVVHGDRLVGFVDRTAILRHVELSRSSRDGRGRGLPDEDDLEREDRRGPDPDEDERSAGPGSGERANAA